jgi:hypothetical protein
MHSARTVTMKRSAYAFACGARIGVWITFDAFAAEDLVERRRELAVAGSWIRKRIRSNTPVRLRLRAYCVTQSPVGLVVQPAKWTRRLPSSMKNST